MISIFFRAPITLPFIEASSIFFLHYWRCDRFPQLFVVCWRLHVWPWWSLHGQVWFEHFATKRPVLIKMSLSSDDHFSLHDSNIWICDHTFSFSEPGAHLKREGLAASRFLISFYQTAETNKKLTKFKLQFFSFVTNRWQITHQASVMTEQIVDLLIRVFHYYDRSRRKSFLDYRKGKDNYW